MTRIQTTAVSLLQTIFGDCQCARMNTGLSVSQVSGHAKYGSIDFRLAVIETTSFALTGLVARVHCT